MTTNAIIAQPVREINFQYLQRIVREAGDTDECVLFERCLSVGYGVVCIRGEYHKAHRVVLADKLGRALLDGDWCLHKCDVRNCVNPKHLRVGTAQDNMQDMMTRGRGACQRPEHRALLIALSKSPTAIARNKSAQHIALLTALNKSPEKRARMSFLLKGVPRSEEVKAKISAGHAARNARRRAEREATHSAK